MDASRRPERLWSDTRRKGALQPIKDAPTASFTADEFPCRQRGQARVRQQHCRGALLSVSSAGGAAGEFTEQLQLPWRQHAPAGILTARCLSGRVLHTGTSDEGATLWGPGASPASCCSRPCR